MSRVTVNPSTGQATRRYEDGSSGPVKERRKVVRKKPSMAWKGLRHPDISGLRSDRRTKI